MRTTSNRPRAISRTSSGVSNRFRMIPTSIRNLRLRRRTHGSPAGAACTSLMPGEANDGGPGQMQRLVGRRFAGTKEPGAGSHQPAPRANSNSSSTPITNAHRDFVSVAARARHSRRARLTLADDDLRLAEALCYRELQLDGARIDQGGRPEIPNVAEADPGFGIDSPQRPSAARVAE